MREVGEGELTFFLPEIESKNVGIGPNIAK